MNRFPSLRPAGKKGSVVPRVEQLEDRTLPVSNFLVLGNTLIITGPTTPRTPSETIFISDNGGSGLNNVTAFGGGAPFRPNAFINTIQVLTGRELDTISYSLTGDLTSARTVNISTGGGQDHINISLRANMLTGSSWTGIVNAGPGNDVLTVNQVGLLASGVKMSLTADMGAGNDVANVFTGGIINSGAAMAISLTGGTGSDQIFSGFNGQSNGMQSLMIDAGSGNDSVFGSYELNDQSTGTILPSFILGGDGNDTLTLIVHNRGIGQTNDQIIDGGNGIDKAFRTNAVVTSNVEIDHVVP
jgi:hypothetical protein